MSILGRCFLLIFLAFSPVFGHAASVPLILPTASPPETCEEDVWDIIKARADMEANREITQNQNLISKPDSVLMLTCFDMQMGHLGDYAQDHFPSGPDESLNNSVSLGGVFTDIMVIFVRETLGDLDPYLTGGRIPPNSFTGYVKGGQLIHLLEILVLDNLVDDVSSISNTYDDAILLSCGKDFYIDDNAFDGVLMGRRANATSGNIEMENELPEATFNGCGMMNEIWNQARCMNFQMDTTGAMRDNDAFHTLQDYVDNEIAGNDYRIYPEMCQRRTYSDGDLTQNMVCHLWEHGIPPLPASATDWMSFILNLSSSGASPWTLDTDPPTYWQDLDTQSAVVSGGPGGTDPYLHQRDMFRSSSAAECSAVQPVRNGLIAQDRTGNQYYDAVCPAAGCWFDPPTSLSGTGTCNR